MVIVRNGTFTVVVNASPYEIVPYLPVRLNLLCSLDRFERRKGVEPGAEYRPVCPLLVWSVKNGAFRVWGCKTKISCHKAMVRDRVRDGRRSSVLKDVMSLKKRVGGTTDCVMYAVLQQNVPEVGVCSVRRASVS